MVETTNSSETPLLSGPYNAYIGGAFAGRGYLPLTASGQNMTLGFSTETQLRAIRELQEKTTTVRGGNKVTQYTYRIRLSNFTGAPVKARVWDRMPIPPDGQVTVSLGKTTAPLSDDAVYVSQQKARGLLRWDVEVPAKAMGADAFVLAYDFTVEHDKNYDIGELPAQMVESMRKDLNLMRQLQSGAAQMQ
jgi:hypothetical protein